MPARGVGVVLGPAPCIAGSSKRSVSSRAMHHCLLLRAGVVTPYVKHAATKYRDRSWVHLCRGKLVRQWRPFPWPVWAAERKTSGPVFCRKGCERKLQTCMLSFQRLVPWLRDGKRTDHNREGRVEQTAEFVDMFAKVKMGVLCAVTTGLHHASEIQLVWVLSKGLP